MCVCVCVCLSLCVCLFVFVFLCLSFCVCLCGLCGVRLLILLSFCRCTEVQEKIALSRRVEKHWRLIGWGEIRKGVAIETPGRE